MSQNFDEKVEKIMARNASYNLNNMVVMANDMIKGITSLSLNEHKLLRFLIMQIRPEDEELYIFKIKIKDFADILEVGRSNLYREVDRMTDHLMNEFIRIRKKDGVNDPKYYKKIHWVEFCEYEYGILTIKLSSDLKDYIIGLKKWYTQYRLEDIVKFKSVYSIRIYELIQEALKNTKPFADKKATVYIDIKTIRQITGTETVYKRVTQFKENVIDLSIRDINDFSSFHVEVEPYREQRKIVGFYFFVMSKVGYSHKKRLEEKKPEQLDLWSYQDE